MVAKEPLLITVPGKAACYCDWMIHIAKLRKNTKNNSANFQVRSERIFNRLNIRSSEIRISILLRREHFTPTAQGYKKCCRMSIGTTHRRPMFRRVAKWACVVLLPTIHECCQLNTGITHGVQQNMYQFCLYILSE